MNEPRVIGEPVVTGHLTYKYPGIFVSEETSRTVEVRDPERVAREAPEDVFAFRYHDTVSVTMLVDGKELRLRSRAIRESPLYYIDAEKMTVADVAAMPGNNEILISNMRANNWPVVLRCRTGNFQPLEPGDVLLRSR